MSLPAEKAQRYYDEFNTFQPPSDARARTILFDLKRDLKKNLDRDVAANIYTLVGMAHTVLGEHAEALAAHRNALKLDPAAFRRGNLGAALLEAGRAAEALDEFVASSPEDDYPVPVMLKIARALGLLGQHEDARDAFQDALDRSTPTDSLILALHAAELGYDVEAVELLARSVAEAEHTSLGDADPVSFLARRAEDVRPVLANATTLWSALTRVAAFKNLSRPVAPWGNAETPAGGLAMFEATAESRARATDAVLGGGE